MVAEGAPEVGHLGLGAGWRDMTVTVKTVVQLFEGEAVRGEREHGEELHLAGREHERPAANQDLASTERPQFDDLVGDERRQ